MDEELKLKILYVDDSEAQLESVKARLTAEGHTVLTALDSMAAIRQLDHCDLVIVDFHMPGLDGAQLLAILRPLAIAERTTFYLYTFDPDVASLFRGYGFDGAFTRKGSLDDLVSQLTKVAQLVRLRRFVRKSSART